MKTYIINLEVDDNITLEDIEASVIEMIDNHLATTYGTYDITENELMCTIKEEGK